MVDSRACPDINGATELEGWFGEWPTFHDAEVLEIVLSVERPSLIRLRTWKVSKDVDSTGHFVRTKQMVVTFELRRVLGMELFEFSHQNVLNGALLARVGGGYRIEFEQLHGVGGWIAAMEIVVSFTPDPE